MRTTALAHSNLTGSLVAGTDLIVVNLDNADLSGVRFQPGSPDARTLRPGNEATAILPQYPVLTQAQLVSAIANPENPPLLLPRAVPAQDRPDLEWKTRERGDAWAAHSRCSKQ